MQHFTWASPSRRVKYQCPLDQDRHWRISPRTHTGPKLCSIRPFTGAASWLTVSTSRVEKLGANGRGSVMSDGPPASGRLLERLQGVLEQHRDRHLPHAARHRRD